MTCIVGIVGPDGVVLAADSLGSGGGRKSEYLTSKLISLEVGEQVSDLSYKSVSMAIGYTHSFRMGDLLKHNFVPPVLKSGVEVERYMVSEFIPAVIKCFDDNHYTTSDKGAKEGGNFLVAFKGRLFEVQTDFSVLESAAGFTAIGSGEAVALGALYALGQTFTVEPTLENLKEIAGLAVEAASELTTSVGGEIFVMEVGNA